MLFKDFKEPKFRCLEVLPWCFRAEILKLSSFLEINSKQNGLVSQTVGSNISIKPIKHGYNKNING